MKNKFNYFPILLFFIVLLSFIFIEKQINIAPHLNISIGLLIYSFTFIILIYSYNKFNIKVTKQTIFSSFIFLLLLYFVISILNSIVSITDSKTISDNLINVFTPNYFIIKDTTIYYPNLINLSTFSVVFFITHYIFITIYEAIKTYSGNALAFILSLLISFILDQILYVPLVSLHDIINKNITYNLLIENITASFIFIIFSSVIMLGIFILTNKKKIK